MAILFFDLLVSDDAALIGIDQKHPTQAGDDLF